MTALLTALLLTLAAQATAETQVRPTPQGFELLTGNPSPYARLVRLTAINEATIRVQATPENTFRHTRRRSLTVLPQPAYTGYEVRETDTGVTLATPLVSATADRRTGRLTITESRTGRLLLQEADGGKEFTPYTSPQKRMPPGYTPSAPGEVNWGKSAGDLEAIPDRARQGWSWTARFRLSPGEALYGLGQHQSGAVNWRGRDEELYQYNTKVSVPVAVSTRGYGLLWDTYSLCRWGSTKPYAQIGEVFRLRDKDGREGALTGTYTTADGRKLSRREDSICFEDCEATGLLPKIRLEGATAVYEGWIEAPADGLYRFMSYYAGYTRIEIGGREAMAEHWRTAWNPNTCRFEARLKKGRPTKIRIEWRPDGGVSYCGLRAAPPADTGEQDTMTIWSEMSPDMDYYIMAGGTADGTVSLYRRLTGKAAIPPKWAMGFWQSRERYKTQDELLSTLAEFRRRHIPVDNIVQDWSYWREDEWGSHEFDPDRYPDPEAMLDSVHALHARFMISVWPKFYDTTANYRALDSRGWMYRQAITDSIRDWIGRGHTGSFYDAYSLGARRMFWQQMDQSLYTRYGRKTDAWWMDASEPNVRDCTPLAYRKLLCGPTALGTSDEYFNAYALMNAEAIYSGQRGAEPDRRVFLLTRSGFAGQQRYATATWSGDIACRWEDMRAQAAAGLNFSIAGIPLWGMDTGGFTPEARTVKAAKAAAKEYGESPDLAEWRELQTRWHQMGCFVPLYRAHGQWPPREVWNIAPEGHPAYESITACHRLRYRLMPYIYSLAGWTHTKDYTIMRPLAMDFAEDTNVHDIDSQWMFGPALMACPVFTYKARTRKVYLPKGRGWYDIHTRRHHTGGHTIKADAPYGRIPLFAPEGAILPTGPAIEHTAGAAPDSLTITVYSGRDGQFTLYDDDGLTYAYERGESATADILWADKSRQLTITPRQGTYKGMPGKLHLTIRLITPRTATERQADYDGRQLTINLLQLGIRN